MRPKKSFRRATPSASTGTERGLDQFPLGQQIGHVGGAAGFFQLCRDVAQARNSAIVGLAANTAVAQGTSLYLRYDGEVGTGSDSHMLSAGIRLTW